MQPTLKAIPLATIFFAISVLPSQMLACGWWGDGEINLESSESTFFIPRGDGILSDPADMARLSTAYRTGEGVEKNDQLAVTWARRAAAAGHPGAMNDLAYMYEIGLTGEIDEKAATFWYKKAADHGIPAAEHSLSSMLRSGRGADVDVNAANTWLRRAAEHGHPSAAGELAMLIWYDEIVETHPNEGCFWWLVAIKLGLDASSERCIKISQSITETKFHELSAMAEDWTERFFRQNAD